MHNKKEKIVCGGGGSSLPIIFLQKLGISYKITRIYTIYNIKILDLTSPQFSTSHQIKFKIENRSAFVVQYKRTDIFSTIFYL